MSGRFAAAQRNLTLLQDLIKKDAESYQTEFEEQYLHYANTLRLFALQPTDMDVGHLLELVGFISQVGYLYPATSKNFGPDIVDVLKRQGSKLEPELRLGLLKALVVLRNRKVLPAMDLVQLFFEHLLKIQDKTLRKFAFTTMVAHVKMINRTVGQRNPQLNTTIENYVIAKLRDSSAIVVRSALLILMECFRKRFWQDAKTTNAIAETCFHKIAKIKVTGIQFFLGSIDDPDGNEDSDSDLDNDQDGPEKSVNEVMLGYRVGKKSKGRQKTMQRAKKALEKQNKSKKKKKSSVKEANTMAVQLLYDPDDFAERLFAAVSKSTDRFEVKMMTMGLVAKVIGVHQLVLLGFYPYLHRYLQPKQRDVTKILLYAAQASHEMVPPDCIEAMLKTIVNNFVTDRNSTEAIAVGLNAVREIVAGCPFAMGEDLLQDLTEYKKYKNKNVAMAARSLIQLFRAVNPALLNRKDRGRPMESTTEIKTKEFGKIDANAFVAGAECLDVDAAEKDVQEPTELGSDEDDDSDDDSGWIDVAESSGEEEESDGEEGETKGEKSEDGTISKDEKAELISANRILTQDDFRKIAAHQLKKQIQPLRRGAKRKGEIPLEQLETEESELLLTGKRDSLPRLADIERLHKKRKQDKASRLESVHEGREGREKFGRPKPKGPHVGRTNKNMSKNKNFQMTKQKHKKKNKRSFQERQRSLRKHLVHQKKMK